ncbi:DoxX family protein [Rhodococcus globerulus]|uniref:DoxX family protein n=1 Tax=Rhodococcus globerulus TaxID=33008 RepID=A0ABU4C4N4_RHOGO|nr:DoxX family protein [Rhodococcus globerulus]MDV6271467.1 DoxX family protein [Rhodococcus globerulus]
MNIALWIVAGLLALVFVAAGASKVVGKREKMIEKTPYVQDFPQWAVRAIGVAEVLGAIALIVPAFIGSVAVLVPIAAVALALVMVGAVVTHLRRGEGISAAAPAIVLALLALFVAWGRFGTYGF